MNANLVQRTGYGFFKARPIQFLIGLFLALSVPMLYGVGLDVRFFMMDTTTNSVVGAGVSVATGYWLSQRLQSFPGVSSGYYTVLCFSVTFGLLVLIMFLFRLEYSRVLISISYLIAVFWFIYVNLSQRFTIKPSMALLRQGDTSGLLDELNVSWTVLNSPSEYHDRMGLVVADLRESFDDEWLKFLTETSLKGIPVYHVKHMREELFGQVSIESLEENNFGSLLPNMTYLQIKLFLDIGLSLLVAIPIGVILLILYPVCLIKQGRPFFYRQTRMGYRGKPFTVYKLRSMECADAGSECLEARKTKAVDDRITSIGRFLRRTRIDEIPQVLNIIRGEMSWIGPRPEAVELSDWYEGELAFYRYRHIVRPGISGWAQVNQGHVTELHEVHSKLNLDFFYIKNISFWLDFLILVRTVKIVLTGFGSK